MADDQELYGEAEAGVTEEAQKSITIITKGFIAPKPQAENSASPRSSKISDQECVGTISVKDRLAKLQAMNNGGPPNLLGPKPGVGRKPPPQLVKKPVVDTTNNNSTPTITPSKPPISNKPGRFTPSPNASTGQPQVPNLKDIKVRKQSLKFVQKRDSQLPESQADSAKEEDDDVIVTKDQRKFKKNKFVKKPGKPSKPATVNGVTLPIVQLTDVETGVESRIGGGRTCLDSGEFQIQSMTEEDELEESSAPALPQSSHPSNPPPSLAKRKPLPPPPMAPEPSPLKPTVDPTIEELYSEGQAEANLEDPDGQELYEEFDEVLNNASPSSTMNHVTAPEPPALAARGSPEPTKKLTKEEKKEKLKQEKLEKEREKQRIKETKEREAFLKKHKVTQDELVSSHYVEARVACSGGKGMLAVKEKDRVQLIRKTNCPDGKWIVRNPHTDVVGLVESKNMIDLEEELPASNGVNNDIEDGEDIYEELA